MFLELNEAHDHILVTGDEVGSTGNSYLKTIRYDEDGKILWESIHDGNTTALEKATGLLVASDDVIIVTGVIQLSPSDQEYEVVTYKPYFYDVVFDYDSLGLAVNVDKEIIVRFNPSVLDTNFIDDQGMLFGSVSEVVTDVNVINLMDQKLNAGGRLKDWRVRKIFDFLDRDKKSITSRFGNKVYVPSVWSALVLELEEGMDEIISSDSINTIQSNYTWYAHPNLIYHPDSDFYDDQGNLHGDNNTIFPNAHINVEEAWNNYPYYGNSNIKVGIFDTGIKFDHLDFTTGGPFGGLAGSIVDAGFDFTVVPEIVFDDNSTNNDPLWGHGTKVAGIIAALRKNDEGIEGIAGGDMLTGDEGVHLIAFTSLDGDVVPPNIVGEAACRGLCYALINGINDEPMIQLANYSWSGEPSTSSGPDLLKEMFYSTYKAGIIHVASRGNEGTDDDRHPGTYNDYWEITVGSSGTDGRHKTEANSFFMDNNPNLPVGHDAWKASYGKNLDLIAPGTSAIIYTTHNGVENYQGDACYDRFEAGFDYGCFNGASAATPHVLGVSALLLDMHEAKYDTKLTVEDIEHLLEYGAKDVSDNTYPPSEDQFNGWGLLDAGGALDLISGTQKVVHLTIEPTSIINVCSDPEQCYARLYQEYESPITGTVFPSEPSSAYLDAHVFEYSANLNIDVCPDNASFVEFADSNKMSVWKRNSMTNLWDIPIEDSYYYFTPESNMDLEIVSLNDCQLNLNMTGYSMEVFKVNDVALDPPEMIPTLDPTENYVFNISILIDDPDNKYSDDIILDTDEAFTQTSFNLYPNPVRDQLYIYGNQILNGSEKSVTLEIFDINGILLQTHNFDLSSSGDFEGKVSLDSCPSGMYFCRMKNEHQYFIQRFVKI